MLHKQRIRSRQPEEKFEKAVKYTLKNKYREKWNILKIPWKVYEIRKQLDVSFIILMLIRGLSWKNWEERAIKGSRGAIVFYNNNQPSHLLEMDYKIWPNIQQRREAKGRIVVIEVPTHPPLPPLNPPKLVIRSEETNLQESTFFSLSGFATKQV